MAFLTLNQTMPSTDDFFFRALTEPNNPDAIVICNPLDAICRAPVILHSKKPLEEHIKHIQEHNLKKAVVIAEDISFLKQCPSLEYLWVIPALTAIDFDFSPVYELPNLRWLQCETVFGPHDEKYACIDYCGNAVKIAWRNEQDLVIKTGQGTRNWTASQIDELINTGKVRDILHYRIAREC